MKRFLSLVLVSALLLALSPKGAMADDSMSVTGKRAKVVAKSALYGFGGGLVVGLASQVFKKKTKNVFLFGSLGLYAGIILGVYVISTASGPAPYEGPDTYDDFSWNKAEAPGVLARNERKADRPDLQVNFLNVKF